jgi:hypothetical protein
MPLLEEVFRLSGVPTYTFVEPVRYDAIKVAVRTPGRCLVLEGPSGIGKTTVISKATDEVGISSEAIKLSARKKSDLELIAALPDMSDIGTVIVDDFHRLPDAIKARLSDFMKVLADEGNEQSKLILIGINKAGTQLIKFAHDLGMRLDVFRLEANPPEKIEELIALGEQSLNIQIDSRTKLAERAQGSFHIAQVLCHTLCIAGGVTETQTKAKTVNLSADAIIEQVMTDLEPQFAEPAITFARGSKLRREGRAPYLHILKWLSESTEWSLDLKEAINQHPEHKGSIGQVIEKGHLEHLLRDKGDILTDHFHYEPTTAVLSVENPKLSFYLKNQVWRAFTRKAGYTTEYFKGAYDFALSFAGADRSVAERLFGLLNEREISVFYDINEQHRIVAMNIEDYLGPIYRSEARYVVPLLSPDYPTRIWTKFESDNFAHRFGENAVIPIWFSTVKEGYFSDERKFGGLAYDPAAPIDSQLEKIATTLAKRLVEDREKEAREALELESSEDFLSS